LLPPIEEEALMSELNTHQRDRLPRDEFAYIDREGGKHLPINDAAHVRNAMARWNQTDFESKAAKERARKSILRAAEQYDIEIADDDKIRKTG
jgi:hypothetical protein